ncbi:DUF11 domain-containing protein [Kamptonema formosum]|uniref:DUF11 domain-containing protein n=1 Tax=Kamptonema formosum TaxID=331992 RepID=UPI0003663FF8|nr:DUF11 domain-containing protein [Oscillatoria sp. PCC 10802]
MNRFRLGNLNARDMGKTTALAALLICGAGWWSQPVRAEGSRSLYPQTATGSRANLEWRSSAAGALKWGNILERRTLLKVYAQAGEVILLGSSAVNIPSSTSGDILIYNPGQVTGSIGNETIPAPGSAAFRCSSQSGRGRISTRAEELAGPNTVPAGGVSGGYTPCYFTAPTTGIYDVVFYGPSGFSSNNNGAASLLGKILDDPNNFNTNQGSSVSSWDVTVRSSLTSTTDINGRLFSYGLSLYTGNETTSTNGRPVFATAYVVTTDGYRYKTNLGGIDPAGFMIYGNLKGFLDSDGVTPLYHDVLGNNSNLITIQGGASLALPQFPLFLSDVNNNMEAERVLSALGIPTAPVAPAVSAPTFTGTAGGNNSKQNTGGTFSFSSNITGTYELIISGYPGLPDTDPKKFDPADPKNRLLRNTMTVSGTQSLTWDGKDNSGNFFPLGNNYEVRVIVHAGEYHFPLLDVESSTQGGPSFTLLNPPSTHPLGVSTAFFDDTNYKTKNGTSVSVTTCGTPPAGDPAFPKRSNPINGFDSVNQASYRAFGNLPGINAGTSCNGDFGDAKGLDLWTYFPGLSPKGTLNIVGFPDLTIAKTHTGNFTAGGQGTYTISVSNAANAGPTTGTITVTDTLPNGLTFVSGSGSGWTCSASGQTVTCTNAGPLAAGASSTITLTVNATAAGNVTNSASVSTPEETNTGNNSATDSTTVTAPNTPPVAEDKTAPATANNVIADVPTLTGTDTDGTVVSYTISTLPDISQGKLS